MTMTEEEIKALQDTNNDLVERVNQLESINVDLVAQKKEFKQKLEEGLTDEDAKTEINSLKNLLAGVEDERNGLIAEHSKQVNGMRMKDLLRESGIKAQNSDALEALSGLVLDGSTYEDGFTWKNEDGSTRYNEDKKPYGVIDRVNELREGDKSYLFQPITGGGAAETISTAPSKPSINDIINAGLKY